MKVLIAYDGSDHAQAALAELRRAGLPQGTESLIVSVAGGMSSSASSAGETIAQAAARRVSSAIVHAHEQGALAFEEACELALEASRRIRSEFPSWEVRVEGLPGIPAAEIIRTADEWRADAKLSSRFSDHKVSKSAQYLKV